MTSEPDRREMQHRLDQARLETFVVRARRIQAHSLAQDPERLRALANGATQVTFKDGKTFLSYDHPPEEVVESAAARVRPLLLDDVSMLSVLKAITSLTADTDQRDEVRQWAAAIRSDWKGRTGRTPDGKSGFTATYESSATGETSSTNHLELALAWIYGDVVHHDADHLERTRHWGVGERYRAAVPLVAYVITAAIMVLESVREMHAQGMLEVTTSAWECDVVAEAAYEHEISLYVSEVGGAEPPPSPSDPLGSGWVLADGSVFASPPATGGGPDREHGR